MNTRAPAFAHDLAAELGFRQGDAERTFRYLAEKNCLKGPNLCT